MIEALKKRKNENVESFDRIQTEGIWEPPKMSFADFISANHGHERRIMIWIKGKVRMKILVIPLHWISIRISKKRKLERGESWRL